MLSLFISALVFFVAAWFLNQYLDGQGIPNGITRVALVLLLASLTSWGVWWAVEFTQLSEPHPQDAAQTGSSVTQILKAANQGAP